MKSKIVKIGGVGLTLALLVSLIIAAVPASAGTLAWSGVTTPSASSKVLVATSDVDFLAVAPDGETMFAYDNAAGVLYKSTSSGAKWTTTNIGENLNTKVLVGLAVSPDYANDSTVVAATATEVFRSINGGKKFGDVGSATLTGANNMGAIEADTITSVDVATHYLGGLAILVGTQDDDGTAGAGGVFRYTTSGLDWSNLTAKTLINDAGNVAIGDTTITVDSTAGFPSKGTLALEPEGANREDGVTYTGTTATTFTGIPAVGLAGSIFATHADNTSVVLDRDVLAVAFSPQHQSDAQYLAVATDGTNAYLSAKFGGDAWSTGVEEAKITGHAPASAVIAFPDDYEWSSNNRVLVGTAGAGDANNDLYRVHGALPGGSSKAYNTGVNGTGTDDECDVHSIAVKGAIAEATVLVGQKDSTTVKRTSDVTASTVSWKGSTKSPTGGAAPNVQVILSPADGDAYAATTGTHSAFSRSADGGVTWNQLALIDVSALANGAAGVECAITIADIAVIDNSTMYVILADSGADMYESLFKTTDGGSSWERVWCKPDMKTLAPSPDYAEDSTLFITDETTRIWRTSNGGETFVGLTAPKAVTAIGVVDKSTYYTGHDGSFYKSGRWTEGDISDAAVSIVVADDGTIFVGTDDGDVRYSTDDGKTFKALEATAALGANNRVIVALDTNYADNNYLYAGVDGVGTATKAGIWRWEYGTSSVFKEQYDGPGDDTLAVSGLALSADGTLYAANSTPIDVGNADYYGISRSLYPAGSSAVWNYQEMYDDLGDDTSLLALNIVSGSNVLYTIADLDTANTADAIGSYGYEQRLMANTDILAIPVKLAAPKDGTVSSSSGKVTFSWTAIDAPMTLHYQLEAATDAKFANKIVKDGDGETTGTALTSKAFDSGTDYWWRVYVEEAGDAAINSRKSDSWQFTPALVSPTLQSPTAGADEVIMLPTFSWASVAGATSYELEVAENPFFANSDVKKPLTHTTWTWDDELVNGTTYYWRVRGVKSGKGILTNVGPWTESVFTVNPKAASAVSQLPAPVVTVQPTPAPPAPSVTVQPPAATVIPAPIVNVPAAPAPAPSAVTPGILLAIIIIGAVLLIAVIVLIVRTRRIS